MSRKRGLTKSECDVVSGQFDVVKKQITSLLSLTNGRVSTKYMDKLVGALNTINVLKQDVMAYPPYGYRRG